MKSFVGLQPSPSSTQHTLSLFQFYTSSVLQYIHTLTVELMISKPTNDFWISPARTSRNESNSRYKLGYRQETFDNKDICRTNVKTGLFDSVHAHARTFPGKSAFRKRRRQFFRGYYAPVPISSFDQGCAWIFDRRARPQWEICTAKRITDVFVRLVTMGSRLEPIP